MKASTQGLLIAGGVSVVALTLWLVLKPKNVVTEYTPTPQPPSNPTNKKTVTVKHNGKNYEATWGKGGFVKNLYWRDENGDTWVKIGDHGTHMTNKIIKTGMDFDDYTK